MVNLKKREFLRSIFLTIGAAATIYVLSKIEPLLDMKDAGLPIATTKRKAKIRVTEDGSLIVG